MFSFFVCSSFQCSWVLPLECDNNFSLCKQAKKKYRNHNKTFLSKPSTTRNKSKSHSTKIPRVRRGKILSCSLAEEENVSNISGKHLYPKLAGISPGEEEMFIFPLPLLLDSSTTSCFLSLFLDCLPLTLQLCALLLKILSHA